MHQADFVRTLIIGNSGAGKSWLAERLAEILSVAATDLDGIHWGFGGDDAARDKVVAIEMVRQIAAGNGWIIEGVYARLATEALERATALVWLDVADDECIANLRERIVRLGGEIDAFSALFEWAAAYRVRDNASSFAGHARLFSAFGRAKFVLRSRPEMDDLLRRVADG